MDPDSHIRTLQYELMAKSVQLSAYYEKNYSRILDVYNELNYDLICERCEFIDHFNNENIKHDNVYLSFCLLNIELLYFSYKPCATLLLFGVDYVSTLNRLKNNSFKLAPEKLGSALSDINRARILEIILEKGECTCKELEKELGLSASTTYHHLNTLCKCSVIYTKNMKKSVYYRINRVSFESAIEYLKKFCEDDKNQA
jgi:predicted transcriptional regulator